MNSTVDIVIVNYRTAQLVLDCLKSVEPELQDGGRVWITDNASGDESVAVLKAFAETRAWLTVLPLDRNGGFSFGNNAAICKAFASIDSPKYVWLLNPDTVVRPGALGELVRFMDDNPNVGIAGSRLEDRGGRVQCSAHRFPSLFSELDSGMKLGVLSQLLKKYVVSPPIPNQPHSCDWVSGASIIVRREVFDDIGLMDDEYFLYFEEVDFCFRTKKNGWEVWYVPASQVVHLEGESTGIRKVKRRPGYWFASRRRFFVKNYGVAYATCTDCARVLGEVLYSLRRFVGRKTNNVPPYFVLDLIKHSIFSTDQNARVSGKNN